jgi:heptosyltransferase-2
MKKFLIIQTAFIGDVVLATVIVEKLHQFFPEAKIDMMVRKGNEGLLYNHPLLTEVLIWNKKENKFSNLARMIRKVRKNRYDTVINVQRFAATGLITALSGARQTIGFDKNPLSFLFSKKIPHLISPDGEIIHEVTRNLKLIGFFTDMQPVKPALYPSVTDVEKISPYIHSPFITISPASVWFTKQYPPEKWRSFLFAVPEKYTVYLLGAPGDKELAETILHGIPRNIVNLCGQLSFLQSAALMKRSVMNYVNDSAPLHFASAMNAPVAAVYCSTIPAFGFGPLSDQQTVIELMAPLYCRPCGLHGYKACPEGHFLCAHKITDQQLLAVLSS